MKSHMKSVLIVFTALALLITLIGCNSGEETKRLNDNDPCSIDQKQQASADSEQTTYPITLKDASGVEVTFTKAPERIISIAPSETEVLYALGLGERVVGVDQWSDFPEEAKSKTKVGDMNVNVEKIISLKPDLIVGVQSMSKDTFKALRDLKQTVFTAEPKTVGQVIERIETIGLITNRQDAAQQVFAAMKAECQQVVEALSTIKDKNRKKVYIEFDTMYSVGKGEFGHDLIELAKGINIGQEKTGWFQIDDEFVITENPDIILYASYNPQDPAQGEAIKQRSGWKTINAVKNNRVIALDVNMLSRPGPRITKSLLEIARGVYPELVK